MIVERKNTLESSWSKNGADANIAMAVNEAARNAGVVLKELKISSAVFC